MENIRLLLSGGALITGDGTTFLERCAVRIRGTRIADVAAGDEARMGETVLNAEGCTVLPGIINAHAHGCVRGPSMPSGSLPFDPSSVAYQRNRHLLSGTTTLLNVCGLAMADEVDEAGSSHPLDIQIATAHTPSNIAAALAVDGKGLSSRHRNATVDELVAAGCKVLGEAGGGQTLGGGAQDYRFIPAAVRQATGAVITPATAGLRVLVFWRDRGFGGRCGWPRPTRPDN
jgi:imidazolonepropionase-like amidohydrolase